MFGGNIKIHFAGCEQIANAHAVRYGGGQYQLWTCYPFIAKKLGIKFHPQIFRPSKNINIPKMVDGLSKHDILDSGIFTLMFGAGQDLVTERLLDEWFELLIDFINGNQLKASCVEIDCQRILGVDKAWEYRQRFKDALPNNRQINVFHLPDGKKGLDRLIEFSDYIALGISEFRRFKRKTYKQDVPRIARYIKNKKPEIDIHLLGCTECSLLKNLSFCTSSDSTSWLSGLRYGKVLGKNINSIRKEIILENEYLARKIFESLEISKYSENGLAYLAKMITSTKLCKAKYIAMVGSQD